MVRAFLIIAVFLAGCATPEYAAPPIDEARVEAERLQQTRAAMKTALERRARVYDLTWPILVANTDLCPETRPTIGIVFADRPLWAKMSGGLREEDLEALGMPDSIRILHVQKDSPADASGLKSGMELRTVNGETKDEVESFGKSIRSALEDDGNVTIGTDEGDFTVQPITTCDVAVKISTSQAINANAIKGDIVIHTGLIRALEDAALQFVIAHEAAHVVQRHPRKYWRNFTVSGAVVAAPFVYGGATVLDMASAALGAEPDVSMQQRSLRLLAPWAEDFEKEADYLGLYLFARAGGDLAGARQTFDMFSVENPNSIYVKATHPLTPERIAALEAAIAELKAKDAAGAPLIPERAGD